MRRRFLIALCSTLILTACSVPKSGPFETISNDDIPFGLNAAQTTAPQSATETTVANLDPPGTEYEQVDLYFIRNAAVTKAQRSVISPVDANGALAALTEGLVEDSTTVGLRSAIPASLEARVDVDRGVATVNATRAFLNSLSAVDQRLAIAQIVLTLTSRPGIGQVVFFVDGKAIAVPKGRGDLSGIGDPVTFDDYTNIIVGG
jgi:spore germination protein GerM